MKPKKDKVLHIVAGLLVSLFSTIIVHNGIFGLMAGMAVGAAKELFDMKSKKHIASNADFIATAAGAIIGAISATIIMG